MKFDLFISDFDWTLGLAPDKIEPETVDAIKQYIKKGGKFVVVSGRGPVSVRNICKKYGFTGVCVGFQGGEVVDIESGEKIFSKGIENDLASKTAELFKATGETVTANLDDGLYYEKATEFTKIYETAVKIQGQIVPDLIEYIKNYKGIIHKINCITKPEKVKELTPKLQNALEGELIVNNGAEYMIEAINPLYSKNFAVRFLAEKFSVPFEKIITVGDSTNDVGLVKGEWHGVAVGDAMQGLKDVAKEITVDFKDQPIKALLEKYCL